jgi:hypothetical protein
MSQCPCCKNELGDLDYVMNQLQLNKINGSTTFISKCCNKEIKAYSEVGMYYILCEDCGNTPILIGAA